MPLSILASGLYTVFAYDVAQVLYQSNEIGFLYIAVLGPLTPFMYLESMVDGILKGLNEQLATFRYSVVDSLLRILLIALLLPRFGMKGFLFVMLVSNLLTSLLNWMRLLHVTELKVQWMRWIVNPCAPWLFPLWFGIASPAHRIARNWAHFVRWSPDHGSLCGCAVGHRRNPRRRYLAGRKKKKRQNHAKNS